MRNYELAPPSLAAPLAPRPAVRYDRAMTNRRETGPNGVEARLVRLVRTAGALAFKLAPTTAGIPDRLIVWPTGVVDFVELKAADGRLAPLQRQRIADLRDREANTFVLYGDPDVDEYVERRVEMLDPRPVR